ncbi:MAG: hypothetical protein ACP5IE_00015 [Infirmifilum sp.]
MSDEKNVRKVFTVEDLVFYTDTSENNYPIYILPDSSIVYKKQPEGEVAYTFNVTVKVLEDKVSRRLAESSGGLPNHPLLQRAIDAIIDITKYEPLFTYGTITYEAYRGDFEELVGEASTQYIKLIVYSIFSFREDGGAGKKSFGVVYTWMKRLQTKYPELAKYVYVSVNDKLKKMKPKHLYALLVVKLPVVSPELEELWRKLTSGYDDMTDEPTAVGTETEEDEEREPIAPTVPVPPINVEEILKPRELELEPPEPKTLQAMQPGTTATMATPMPTKNELVKVYLLSMRLPSRYAAAQTEYTREEGRLVERRTFEDAAAKLETIRRSAYSMISRVFAHVPEFGAWIAVSDEAVKEAMAVSNYVRNTLLKHGLEHLVDRYTVRAVPIYLEPDEAKQLLESAIEHLSEDVTELEERIRKAEESAKMSSLKRLNQDLAYRRYLLEAFKRYLSEVTK